MNTSTFNANFYVVHIVIYAFIVELSIATMSRFPLLAWQCQYCHPVFCKELDAEIFPGFASLIYAADHHI